MNYYGEICISKKHNTWLNYGWSFTGFGLGFNISRYSFNLDFLFFWIGIS